LSKNIPKLFQNRLIKAEYAGLTAEEVKKIYIEETGQSPPNKVEVYYSDDFINKVNSNGFNGTIIHLLDEKQGINQMITITRGSEKSEINNWCPEDWAYNLMGIFVGQNADQFRAAVDLDDAVTSEIENYYSDVELTKVGLGHSLGGNLITLLQLTDEMFDNVYTINTAPPTTYQLALIDESFVKELSLEYNLDIRDNFEAIYDLNPTELEAFAEEYYKEAGENINHLVMDQDFLNALSVVRGFIEVGNFQILMKLKKKFSSERNINNSIMTPVNLV